MKVTTKLGWLFGVVKYSCRDEGKEDFLTQVCMNCECSFCVV